MTRRTFSISASVLASFAILAVFLFTFVAPTFVGAQLQGPVPGEPSPPTGQVPASNGQIPNPLNSNATDINSFIKIVLQKIVLPLGVMLAVFFIIYSGYLFVTARGDVKQIGLAKTTLFYTLIGAAILLGATVITNAVQGTLCQIVKTVGCP